MEEGVTIATVPDWMKLKPEMMRHLIREHEKLGRTLTEEETVALLHSWDSKSVSRSDGRWKIGEGRCQSLFLCFLVRKQQRAPNMFKLPKHERSGRANVSVFTKWIAEKKRPCESAGRLFAP